jgi:mannose-6-phosphate isomerase-like protein (cupin superfamily)
MAGLDWMFSLASVAEKVATLPETERFHYPLRHGSMRVGLYAPHRFDPQEPHAQDEIYIIVSGSGEFVKQEERRPFKPQDVIFVEAGAVHRFENFTADFATWVIFWGPHGGER